MVLHLVPDTYFESRSSGSRKRYDWRRPIYDQHRPSCATGSRITISRPSRTSRPAASSEAYPVDAPMAAGFVTPFGARYEVAVKFVGMIGVSQCPASEQVREIGLQGIEWILTFTFEARRR